MAYWIDVCTVQIGESRFYNVIEFLYNVFTVELSFYCLNNSEDILKKRFAWIISRRHKILFHTFLEYFYCATCPQGLITSLI